MIDSDAHDDRAPDGHDDGSDGASIGVGMGGSCPVCRAPVELGQEFCLECGSPIRFTPRQRRRGTSSSERRPVAAAAPVPPAKGGFPWIPFLVVLALVGGGGAFALLGGQDAGSDGTKDSVDTEQALPSITDSPDPTVSSTETTTLQDCIATGGVDESQPAVTDADPNDGFTPLGSNGEQIPQVDDGSQPPDGSAFDDPATSVPSTDPSSGGDTVTVDQNGNVCDTTATTPIDPAAPVDPTATGPTTTPAPAPATTTTPAATATGDWPAGTSGWTVIVAGYPAQARAEDRAAKMQEDGIDDGGVLLSSDYPSLCPGIYVVFSGTFTSEQQAEARYDELAAKSDYAGMYVREIRTDGDPPSDCRTVAD